MARGQYTVSVAWERNDQPFTDNRYSRRHRWRFDGGLEIPASASPEVVPRPMSDPTAVDPEEAFMAALSSCHMLWFLSIAAKRGFVVDRYDDDSEGMMSTDERGRTAMTRVVLRPLVRYAGKQPRGDEEADMHSKAHEACFIANSVRTDVLIEPRAN